MTFGLGVAAADLPTPLSPASVVIAERLVDPPNRKDLIIAKAGQRTLVGWTRMKRDVSLLLLSGMPPAAPEALPWNEVNAYRIVGALFDGGATDKAFCHPFPLGDRGFQGLSLLEVSKGGIPALMEDGEKALVGAELTQEDLLSLPMDAAIAVTHPDGQTSLGRVLGSLETDSSRYLHPYAIGQRGLSITRAVLSGPLTFRRVFGLLKV